MDQLPAKKLQAEDLAPFTEKELQLLYYIRNKYRFGDIIIKTRNGFPYQILKVTEYQVLDSGE